MEFGGVARQGLGMVASALGSRVETIPCTVRGGPGSRPPVGAATATCGGCRREVWLPAGALLAVALLGRHAAPTCFDCLVCAPVLPLPAQQAVVHAA